MTNSRNPNKGHWNPAPTITHGPKSTPKPDDRKTDTARKGGESR